MKFTPLVALAANILSSTALYQGFNYGSTFTTGAAKQQSDFEAEFNRAKSLQGASCFSSARLYTMIQAGTSDTPISAIPAAIATKTNLLLGLWASAGQDLFDNELDALTSAINQYGTAFTDLIVGISVGSEDLYRITPTGIANKAGVGADPDTLVSYIKQVRSTISGTVASGASVGHVDTWTAWVNGSNDAVISACDWLGMDAYPYFQTTMANSIENGNSTFFDAYDATIAASMGKPVWVTETGWPVSGPTENQAVPSLDNAETYWQDVACTLLGSVNTFWYTLQDASPDLPSPSFGIVGSDLSSAPLYNLTCSVGTSGYGACSNPSSSSSSVAASSSTSSVSSATMPSTAATSGTASIVTTPNVESTAAVSSSSVRSGTAFTTVITSAGSASLSGAASTVTYSTTMAPSSSAASGPSTVTIEETVWETVTSCPGGCATTVLTLSSGQTYVVPTACPASSSALGGSSPSPASSSATSPAAPSGTSCPADLEGEYQYPHLIVPVSASHPNTAYGTQYNGTLSPDVSTIFNFDIPASYAGLTCSLVMLFPEQADLETSAYDFNGKGGIAVDELSAPATQSTTYNTVPKAAVPNVGSISSLQPGNSYVVTSHACGAGSTVAFEFRSTGGLELSWFEDWNPSPLGAFITVC